LASYNIQKESTLKLGGRFAKCLQGVIYVKPLTLKRFHIDYNAFDTVKIVKAKIYSKNGIPAVQQRLTFEDIQLDDDLTISQYNICPESTIHLEIQTHDPKMSSDDSLSGVIRFEVDKVSTLNAAGQFSPE
ncbi:hypothetical protein PMAYCL1PPCAC_24955, partial [Pristionchus mayeri]